MEELCHAFLFSNSYIEFLEYCSLPCIKLPEPESQEPDCCIDVFYLLNGTAELMFNMPPSRTLSSGEFIFLNGKCSDCFIISGGKNTDVLHARIVPRGLYKDLILHQGRNNSLYVLNENNSDVLSAASEMIKLLLNLKKVKSGANLLLEYPITLFFVHLYLNEITGSFLPCGNRGHRFSKLMLEIIKKPGYPWHVKDMAREHCMSTNFFISEFRKVSGFTPFNFIKKTG